MRAQLQANESRHSADVIEKSFASAATQTQQTVDNQDSVIIFPPLVELFRQGQPAQEVYFIESGIVKLIHENQEGQEMIIGLRTREGVLGAASVILKEPFPVSVKALTQCRLRRYSASAFIHRIKNESAFSWNMHLMHCREIYAEISRIAQLGNQSARHRLEQLLWQLIPSFDLKDVNKGFRVQLPLKHWEIAELIAITPQHLSRLMKQMENEGLILQRKGWLIIPDPHRLYHAPDVFSF